MKFTESPFVPNSSLGRDWRLILVSTIIALIGIIFFQWQIAEVIFIFIYDVIFIGMATALRMLFSQAGTQSFFSGLLVKMFWTAGFLVLYSALLVLLISFALTNLNLEGFFESFGGVRTAVWILALNQLFGFLFGFLANGEFRESSFISELFSTMFYMLPTAALLVVVIFPNSGILGEQHKNVWIATAVVLVRFGMDVLALRTRKLIVTSREK